MKSMAERPKNLNCLQHLRRLQNLEFVTLDRKRKKNKAHKKIERETINQIMGLFIFPYYCNSLLLPASLIFFFGMH